MRDIKRFFKLESAGKTYKNSNYRGNLINNQVSRELSLATASSVSKMFLPEAFTCSNDFECYLTHFELLVELKNWKRIVSGTKPDERPHYFALRLRKTVIDFCPTHPDATRNSYDVTIEASRRHNSEKPVVFRGRLARRVQQAGD